MAVAILDKIIDYLKDEDTITTLLGSNGTGPYIFPNLRPNQLLPALVVELHGDGNDSELDGTDALRTYTLVVTAVAQTAKQADGIAVAVNTFLDGSTWEDSSYRVAPCLFRDGRTGYIERAAVNDLVEYAEQQFDLVVT